MFHVYREGKYGVTKDPKQAFQWTKRGRASTVWVCPVANATYAGRHSSQQGARTGCLGQAAQLVGLGLLRSWDSRTEGRHGLDKDLQEAARWLRKVPSCPHQNIAPARLERSAELLAKLT